MITSFATVLRSSVRVCDLVARTGGDEFMVFLPELKEKDSVTVKKHLIQTFERGTGSLPVFIGAAIGASTFGKKTSSFHGMYATADEAMYAHKKAMKKRA